MVVRCSHLRYWGWRGPVQVIFSLLTPTPSKEHNTVVFGNRRGVCWDWCRPVRVQFSPLPRALFKQHKKSAVWPLLSDSSGLMKSPQSDIFTIASCPLPASKKTGVWLFVLGFRRWRVPVLFKISLLPHTSSEQHNKAIFRQNYLLRKGCCCLVQGGFLQLLHTHLRHHKRVLCAQIHLVWQGWHRPGRVGFALLARAHSRKCNIPMFRHNHLAFRGWYRNVWEGFYPSAMTILESRT